MSEIHDYWAETARRVLTDLGHPDASETAVQTVAALLWDTYQTDPTALDYHLDGSDVRPVQYFDPRPTEFHDGTPGIGHGRSRSDYALPVRDPFTGHLTDVRDVLARSNVLDLNRPSDGSVPRVTVAPDPFTGRNHETVAKRSNSGRTNVKIIRHGRAPVQGRTDTDVNGQPSAETVDPSLLRYLALGADALTVLRVTEAIYGDHLPRVTLADGRTTTLLGTDVHSLEDMTDGGLTGLSGLATHRADIAGFGPTNGRTVHALRDQVEPVDEQWNNPDHEPGARDSWETSTHHADADRPTAVRLKWPMETGPTWPFHPDGTRATARKSEYRDGPDRYVPRTIHSRTGDLTGSTVFRYRVRHLPRPTYDGQVIIGHGSPEPRGQMADRTLRDHGQTVADERTVADIGPDQTPETLEGWIELLTMLEPGDRLTGETADGRTWTVTRGPSGTYAGRTVDRDGNTFRWSGARTVTAAARAAWART